MGKYRDLTIIEAGPDWELLVACDSSASIGMKPEDSLEAPIDVVARFALRVPLLELFCAGADPICIVDTLGNEMNPTGVKMIQALKSEMSLAGLASVPLNGSTEDNMPTKMTSLGVTVIGKRKKPGNTFTDQGVIVYKFGEPIVGKQVLKNRDSIISYQRVKKIRAHAGVIDLVPVGSKGISYEINEIARISRLEFQNDSFEQNEYMNKSAGPATVVLASVLPESAKQFEVNFPDAEALVRLTKSGKGD